MVPVDPGGNLLGGVVGLLDLVGLPELGNGLLDPAHPPQVVAVHVAGVGDVGREAGVGLSVTQGVVDAPDVLVGVNEIVVGGEVVGDDRQRLLVEGDRGRFSALSAARGPALLGVAPQQPQLGVVHVGGQRVVEGLLVGEMLLRVRRVLHRVELRPPQLDAPALARAGAGGESLRLVQSATGGDRVVQAGIDPAQPELHEGQPWVGPEGLVEGSGRLDPDV